MQVTLYDLEILQKKKQKGISALVTARTYDTKSLQK